MKTKFPCHLNKAILFAIFLSSLLSVNVHAQIEVGTYSYNRPNDDKFWLRTTEVVGLHATHDKVFVLEQFLVDSGPDSNLYLLHILNKQDSLYRIDTLSVSGGDLDGLLNQGTFIYGSDNYMGIMGHTLKNGVELDSMFLIIYNSQGDLVLDKRFSRSPFCTFYINNHGVTTVLSYIFEEIRQYNLQGEQINLIDPKAYGISTGGVGIVRNKFYGIDEIGKFFSIRKDGNDFFSRKVDLISPVKNVCCLLGFDISADSNFIINYRYNYRRDHDTFHRALCKFDTNGNVLWSHFAFKGTNKWFIKFSTLKNGNTALLGKGLILLNDEDGIIRNNEMTLKDDRLFNYSPQYICDDPSDTTIWTVGWAAQAIDGDTTIKTIVMHFDKNGDPIGTEQNITVTGVAPKSKTNNIGVFTIYPNPAKNVLFLDLSKFNADEIDVSVVSTHGQAHHYKLSSSSSSIDLAAYANGIYVAKAVIDGKVYLAKFLINK